MFSLCRPMWNPTSRIYSKGNTLKFWQSYPPLCWIERRRHSIENCGRKIRDSAIIVTWAAYRKPPSLFPVVYDRISDPLHVWFYGRVFRVVGSNDAFRLHQIQVECGILDNFEWPYLRNGSFDPLNSAHRAVIFAKAQFSCVIEKKAVLSQTWPRDARY